MTQSSSLTRNRQPTIVDVAEAAGVAIGTVSRHINGLPVRAANRDQIEKAISTLGYRRNATAVAMKTDTTRIVGFLVPALSEFHAQVLEHLTRKMRLSGRAVLSFCHDQQPSMIKEGLEFFASHRVDAIVMDGDEGARQELLRFIEDGQVVVLYDNDMPDLSVDRVFVENRKASARAVRHLIELGHERIAIIHGNIGDTAGQERLDGYLDAMAAQGLSGDPELIVAGHWRESGGYQAIEQLMALPSPPTAVFSANYTMSLGVLAFLHERGLKMPDDISLVSFDEVAALRLHIPDITTIAQPIERLADTITNIVAARLSDPFALGRREVRIDADIILRNSTGRPR